MMYRLFLLLLFFIPMFSTKVVAFENFPYSPLPTVAGNVPFFQDGDAGKKKNSLLKRLTAAIKFRKNARAKEQLRVLAIIDSSKLKTSLDSIDKKLSSFDKLSMNRDSSLQELHAAVLELRNIISKRTGGAAGSPADSTIADPSTTIDLPPGEKDIQDLINQITPLLTDNAADKQSEEQKSSKLRLVRSVLFRPANAIDTLTQNDSLKRTYTVKLRNTASITSFYNYQSGDNYKNLDLRLINTLAYYAITFNTQTGNINGLNGWDTASIISKAHKEGCHVALTVFNDNAKNIAAFLRNKQAQQRLTANILELVTLRQADGVIIYFKDLPAISGGRFVEFIAALSHTLASASQALSLSIVLPSFDVNNAYSLPALNTYTNQFLIDFTQRNVNIPGALAPLQGVNNNDMKTCISRYLNSDVRPSKFIAYLPYYGSIWKVDANGDFNKFFNYISYNEIRSKYQLPVQYDKKSTTAFIDIPATGGSNSGIQEEVEIIGQTWFDDDKTFSAKYDHILQSGLGGVAIQALGYDGNYGELRDLLIEKFVTPDTVYLDDIKVTSANSLNPVDDWQWNRPYITAKFQQYHFLFAYPCETFFPKVLKRKWEQAGVMNNDRNAIKQEATLVFGILSLLLLVIILVVLFTFIYQARRLDVWKWKKFFAGLLIFLSILFTLVGFMFFFLSTRIAGFGTSDSPQDCFDFPLATVLAFIFTGVLIGAIITRYLVFPLIKKDEIP